MGCVSTYEDALAMVLRLAVPARIEVADVWDLPKRRAYIAAQVDAAIDVPRFPRAMMDGYAVHAQDVDGQQDLVVVDNIHAGEVPLQAVAPGFAAQIRTGAPVPTGAAAVVRNEWTASVDNLTIRMLRPVAVGESIQPAAQDTKAGSPIVAGGSPLNGPTRAVLRAAGVAQVPVYAPCRVAILCTGSELVARHVPLHAGQIYAANDAFLHDTLTGAGAIVTEVIFVEDNLDSIEEIIREHIGRVDYLLITGGASVGDTDFVKTALQRISGTPSLPLTRVYMRPGAPFIATQLQGTTIFGMSGNPAACFVQFHVLALQAIRQSLGACVNLFQDTAVLSQPLTVKPIKHVRFHRATVRLQDAVLTMDLQANQSSAMITGLTTVNTIAKLDKFVYQAGEAVPLIWIMQN